MQLRGRIIRGMSARRPWIVSLVAIVSLPIATSSCERPGVTVVTVSKGPVESTVTSVEAGIVEPERKASLAAVVSGRICRIYIRERERVVEGAPLVELENDLERLRVEESERELGRLRKIEQDLVTQERIDSVDYALRRARVDYERTFIRAPFPGIIADLNARLGEMTFGSMALAIGASMQRQEPLVYLVDDSHVYVEAEIDEADVHQVAPGQPVKITFGGLYKKRRDGRVVYIAPVVSTQEGESRTATVRVEVMPEESAPASGAAELGSGEGYPDEAPSALIVGMSADVEILVSRVESVIRVPTSVILERGDEKYVYRVEGETLVRRAVDVGLGNWEWTEVRSGLEEGQLVAEPTDLKRLADGLKVKPNHVEPGAAR